MVHDELDAAARTVAQLDPRGNPVYYLFDDVGSQVAEIDAIGQTTYLNYDLAGRRIGRIDPQGRVTYWQYSCGGDLLWRQHVGDGAAYFAYDEAGNRTMLQDGHDTTYWTYDALNRATAQGSLGGVSLAFTFDANGNRLSQQDPDGGLTYWSYDALNRMVSVTDPYGTSASYEYTPAGQLLKRTLGNGTLAYHAYDVAGRAAKVDNRKSDLSAICSFEYTRTAAGDPVSILREDGGYTYYDHDALHRLTCEEQFDAEGGSLYAYEYTYDAAGNRLTKTFNGVETSYEYNTLNELEWEETDGEYTYYHFDASGNQTAKQAASGTTYYQYDHENLMTQIDFPDDSHNYFAWDADSKRVAADDSSGHTEFLYRDPDPLSLIMEKDEAGSTLATYTLGDGLEAMRRDEADGFYHFDWLGSTFALTDAAESITGTWRHDAWGNVLARTGATVNPHTYVGRSRYYWRPDPIMYLLGLRMYDQRLGRFVTRDPLEAACINLCRYVGNRPPSEADPTGLQAPASAGQRVQVIPRHCDVFDCPIPEDWDVKVAAVCDALAACKGTGLAPVLRGLLDTVVDDVCNGGGTLIVYCNDIKTKCCNACGYSEVGNKGWVHICPSACPGENYDEGCAGGVACTLAHELVHMAGWASDPVAEWLPGWCGLCPPMVPHKR